MPWRARLRGRGNVLIPSASGRSWGELVLDAEPGTAFIWGMEVLRRRPGVAARQPPPQARVQPVSERQLPPRVPEELAELDEALKLLGNHIQSLQTGGTLRESLRLRLHALIGGVPLLPDARAWKSGLKELRGDLAALEKRT